MANTIFSKALWVDIAERAVGTFLQAFLGAVVAGGVTTYTGGSAGQALLNAFLVALFAALAAVLKGLAASQTGEGTASFIEARHDAPVSAEAVLPDEGLSAAEAARAEAQYVPRRAVQR